MQSHERRCVMTEGIIPDGWESWVLSRVGELRGAGVSRALAEEFATKEAAGRARLARSVGMQIARAARLDWEDMPSGETRWFFRVPGKLPRGVSIFEVFASGR